MKAISRTLAILAITMVCAALASAQTAIATNSTRSEQAAVRDAGITPAMSAAMKAHAERANRIAQQIRGNSTDMDDPAYTNLSQALLGASEDGLDAASSAQSFKAAMSAIRAADKAAIGRVRTRPARSAGIETEAFGSNTASEFVFYPITPCRLLDTRANGIRLTPLVPYGIDFDGGNPGNAAGCTYSGILPLIGGVGGAGIDRAALVINLTVTGALVNGWIQARPVGSTNVFSNQNFYPGQNIANMVIVQDAGSLVSFDEFELYASQPTHAVVDALGVFAPPMASPLDCVFEQLNGTGTGNVTNGTSFYFSSGAVCPAGYSKVSKMCGYSNSSPPAGLALTESGGINAFACVWRNQTGGTLDANMFYTQSQCCRLPGR